MAPKKTITTQKVTPLKKEVATSAKKQAGLMISHFDLTGAKAAAIQVPQEIKELKYNKELVAQAMRVYQAATKQGTQSTKTRGEVEGSTRKIYRQKGTGKARHGSNKAPLFVGGGITFGPQPRDLHLDLPKKMKRKTLMNLLSSKAQTQEMSVMSGLGKASGKTKDIALAFKKMDLLGRKLLLVIGKGSNMVIRGARNIDRVTVRSMETLSPLDVIKSDHIIMSEEALDVLVKAQKSNSKS